MEIKFSESDDPRVLRAGAVFLQSVADVSGEAQVEAPPRSPIGAVRGEVAPPPAAQVGTPTPQQAQAPNPPPSIFDAQPQPEEEPQRDQKGVPFNGAFCANAKEPFYSSGPNLGQWKKARGISDADYAAWYASELARLPRAAPVPQPVSTAAAFGAAPQQQAQAGPLYPVPTTQGQFMVMCAELQAAGRLTQDQLTAAYQAAGVQVMDLFDSTKATHALEKLYQQVRHLAGF